MGHRPLRQTSDVNYQIDHNRRRIEMLERRWRNINFPAARLTVSSSDMSVHLPSDHLEFGTSFRTNDEEVFLWNEPAHEYGYFGAYEGVGSNPYITCTRGGTFNISFSFGVTFAEDIIGSTANQGEFIVRTGINGADWTQIWNDTYWTLGERDIKEAEGHFLGHGPGAGEPPWTMGLATEIDHKFQSCNVESFGEISFEGPEYFFPMARIMPLFTGDFASSAEIDLGAGGTMIVQWLSDARKECFPG
jgi:hypothetical protein